jgi:hypothetical protein
MTNSQNMEHGVMAIAVLKALNRYRRTTLERHHVRNVGACRTQNQSLLRKRICERLGIV